MALYIFPPVRFLKDLLEVYRLAEALNVLVNRLGSKFLSDYDIIDQYMKELMLGKLYKYVGKYFNNYGLVDVNAGTIYPVITKIGGWYRVPLMVLNRLILCI